MFDPYLRWLAIAPGQRPPTYYQLLGITTTETDPAVIQEAALRQASRVRTHQVGPHAQVCTRMLNEIGQACATLSNPNKRREYDERSKLESPNLPPPLLERPPAPVSAGPPPLPVSPSPVEATASTFGFTTEVAAVPVRFHAEGRRRQTRGTFGNKLAAYLYVCLLCVGGGLGSWVARLTLALSPTSPEKPSASPQAPWPAPGGPNKKAPPNPDSGRMLQE